MAARKLVLQLGVRGFNASPVIKCRSNGFCSLSSGHAEPIGNPVFHALVKGLEAQSLPSKQAEAIASTITDSFENVAHSFVSKTELQKFEILQEANIFKFKSEVQSSQEQQSSKHWNDIKKIQSELRNLKGKYSADQHSVVDEVRTVVSTMKYAVLKFFIASLVSLSAIGMAMTRI